MTTSFQSFSGLPTVQQAQGCGHQTSRFLDDVVTYPPWEDSVVLELDRAVLLHQSLEVGITERNATVLHFFHKDIFFCCLLTKLTSSQQKHGSVGKNVPSATLPSISHKGTCIWQSCSASTATLTGTVQWLCSHAYTAEK